MRLLRSSATLALLALGAAAPGGDWQSLFDGKTLAGWHVASRPEDGSKVFWQVRDGAISCDSLVLPRLRSAGLQRRVPRLELQLARGFRHCPETGIQFRAATTDRRLA
jgi:hypothetical protein